MSDRYVVELMDVGFHTQMSLGSIPAQEQVVSAALEAPVEEAKVFVHQQPSINLDATG